MSRYDMRSLRTFRIDTGYRFTDTSSHLPPHSPEQPDTLKSSRGVAVLRASEATSYSSLFSHTPPLSRCPPDTLEVGGKNKTWGVLFIVTQEGDPTIIKPL
jgi:hypothetical protein